MEQKASIANVAFQHRAILTVVILSACEFLIRNFHTPVAWWLTTNHNMDIRNNDHKEIILEKHTKQKKTLLRLQNHLCHACGSFTHLSAINGN